MMENRFCTGPHNTFSIMLKIVEFVGVFEILIDSQYPDRAYIIREGERYLEYIRMVSVVGFVLIIPAIIVTHFIGAIPPIFDVTIDLIGAILFYGMGALVLETGIPTIYGIATISLPIIIPAIISNYLLGEIPSVLEFIINLVGGALFIAMGDLIFKEEPLSVKQSNQANDLKSTTIFVGMLAISLGVIFLMDFLHLCITTKYDTLKNRENNNRVNASPTFSGSFVQRRAK